MSEVPKERHGSELRARLASDMTPTVGRRHSCRGAFAAALCVTAALVLGSLLPVTLGPWSTPPADAAAPTVSLTRIAGPTRYETAALAAEAWLAARPSNASPVTTALLVSGADRDAAVALVTPALARAYQAPLLLTEASRLPRRVAEFLRKHQIDRVIIVASQRAVSTQVDRALGDLGIDDVDRIVSSDDYETAVAVADHLDQQFASPGEFGAHGRTVVIATGEATADALAVGPFAYSGRHPLLLTPRGSLHPSVARYLRDSGVRHAVIVGGPAAVSARAEDSVIQLGLTTERWYGDDRYATSARIAAELLGSGPPVDCFDGAAVGAAVGTRAADAVASAPLLGERCAPLLLTEPQRVPAVVRRLLGSQHFFGGDESGRIAISVFGGTAAIAADTAGAFESAATLLPIRARISAAEGHCHFIVDFDTPVDAAAAADASNYRIEGSSVEADTVRLDGVDTEAARRAVVVLAGSVTVEGAAVPSRCDRPLQARDEVRIAGGVIGAAQGARTVHSVVSSVADDRSAPRLTVTAPLGADTVWVDAREPIRNVFGEVEFFRRDASPETEVVLADVAEGSLSFAVPVPAGWGQIESGDRVTVLTGAVRDMAGNRSRSASTSARTDTAAPKIVAATVTQPSAITAASVRLDAHSGAPSGAAALVLTALDSGSAAGADGNGWELRFEAERSWKASRTSQVSISFGSKSLRIQAPATRPLRSIVADLLTDSTFERHFSAWLDSDDGSVSAAIDTDIGPEPFVGGESTVDVTVRWSEPIGDCDAGSDAVSPRDIEFDLDGDGDGEYALDGTSASGWNVEVGAVVSPTQFAGVGGLLCVAAAGEQTGTLAVRLRSETAASLPTLRSRLIAHPGAAIDRAGNAVVIRQVRSFSRS